MLILLLQGVASFAAVYDLLSGTRLCRVELKGKPVEMKFTQDGSALVVFLRVR